MTIAVALARQKSAELESDLANAKAWRGAIDTKLDAIHGRITGLETRLYFILGGVAVVAFLLERFWR
jgi:hypothetical protein